MRKQLDLFVEPRSADAVVDASTLPADWTAHLPFLKTDAWRELQARVADARGASTVYPPACDLFRAPTLTPLAEVRVVILGQDPYHGAGQAHGLAFSVPAGIRVPPSLRNILKELAEDIPSQAEHSGHAHDLTPWARQGVLLLNTTLTVEESKPASHAKWGWGVLTDQFIAAVSAHSEHTVFLLWGAHARAKASLIDPQRHHIIESAHPSPLSSHRGFFGSRPFSKANAYLVTHNRPPVNW
jgi:uracil-DNA glycosylase